MRLPPLLLMLEVLLGLIDQQFRRGGRASRPDLLRLGRQLRRVNRLYIRLAASTIEPTHQRPAIE